MAEHQWKKKHFNKPTWCAFCSKFIWGLGKQGFVCTVCTYPVHPKCLNDVDTPCPGKKTQHHAASIAAAKSEAAAAPKPAMKAHAKREESPAEDFVPTVDVDEEEEQKPASTAPPRLVSRQSLVQIKPNKEEIVPNATCIEDVYDIGTELGRGAFSIVYKAKHKATGIDYAVKIIDKKNVQQDLHRLAIEMDILKTVDHPNIIRLKDLFETDQSLYIVTEVVTGGELFDRIVSKGSYSERDAATLTRKLIEALEYLHSKGIAHRDLKPENLLLKSPELDSEVKLADFGLSKIVGTEVMMQTACGTPGYVAPEVLKAQGYGMEVDMWSAGVICYILLCGFPPFYHEKIPLLFEAIMKADYDYPAEYWDHISDDAIDFIDDLLVVDPAKRMTATQALQHKWLQDTESAAEPLEVGGRMNEMLTKYREQSRVNQPSSADAPF